MANHTEVSRGREGKETRRDALCLWRSAVLQNTRVTLPASRTVAISGRCCYFRLVKVSRIRGQSDERCNLRRRVASRCRSFRESDGTSYPSKKEAERSHNHVLTNNFDQLLTRISIFPRSEQNPTNTCPSREENSSFRVAFCACQLCHLCV